MRVPPWVYLSPRRPYSNRVNEPAAACTGVAPTPPAHHADGQSGISAEGLAVSAVDEAEGLAVSAVDELEDPGRGRPIMVARRVATLAATPR